MNKYFDVLPTHNININAGYSESLTKLGNVNQEYTFRNLGWNDGKDFKFFVKKTVGDGNCYINAFYQAIGSLKNLSQDSLFLRDPKFVEQLCLENGVNYVDIDYNILNSKEKHDLIKTFRRHLGLWLVQPYFDGEKYLNDNEALDILNNNVDNIKIWFFDKFLNPNNWIYQTYKNEAIDFIFQILMHCDTFNMLEKYLNELNIIDNTNTNLELLIQNNIPPEDFFIHAKTTNFKGKPFSEYFIQLYVTNLNQLIDSYNFINNINYEEIYRKNWSLEKCILNLSKNKLSEIADNIIERYTENNTPIEDPEKFKKYFVDKPLFYVENIEEYLLADEEIFLEYIKNKKIVDIVSEYIIITNSTDEIKNENDIIDRLCGVLEASDYKKYLTNYIKNLKKLVNYIVSFLSINLDHKKYTKYDLSYFEQYIKNSEDAKRLAEQSIYYENELLASDENVEKEFNTDFRIQTNSKGYVVPHFSDRNGDIFNTDYTNFDPLINKYSATSNYFLFDEGYFMRTNDIDYSLEYLYQDLTTDRQWSGHNVLFVISKILDLEIHVYESYVQRFLYRYQINTALSNNGPLVMINYTGNHYETCGYKNKNNQDVTYFQTDDPFWKFLKDYELYHTQSNVNAWYDENKINLKPPVIKIPIPKLPGMNNPPLPNKLPPLPIKLPGMQTIPLNFQLPGIQYQQSIPKPILPEFKIKHTINPDKKEEAATIALEFGLDLNNPLNVALLFDSRPDLFNQI